MKENTSKLSEKKQEISEHLKSSRPGQALQQAKERVEHNERIQRIREAKRRNKRKVQIISLIAIIVVLAVATALSIPLVKAFSSEAGLEALREKLESYSGLWGIIVFIIVQALQVVIAVIPPIQIVGGLLFGWFLGSIFSFAGTLLGTLVIFLLVKKFGRPLVEAFVDDKLMKRYDFLNDEKKLTAILMALYLIPGIPKDVISYLVPLTPVKRREFFLYVMPCRLPAIVLSTVMGSQAMDGNFKVVLGLIAGAIVIGLLGFAFKEPLLKRFGDRRNKHGN